MLERIRVRRMNTIMMIMVEFENDITVSKCHNSVSLLSKVGGWSITNNCYIDADCYGIVEFYKPSDDIFTEEVYKCHADDAIEILKLWYDGMTHVNIIDLCYIYDKMNK